MTQPLHFTIVSYVDDNFGDNLIRISFQGLLEVALKNHGVTPDGFRITPVSLKNIDERVLETSDVIFFAGGGLFGQSYLGFFEHIDRITALAERHNIPVIFSSMGLNNMGAEGGGVDAISQIVRRKSVKAISVRENLALFQELLVGTQLEARQVSDPAVWTRYLYGMTDVVPDGSLGINVVRGGLFSANQRPWNLGDEMKYLAGLRKFADSAGLATRYYTNGSLDDNNTLRFFQQKYDVGSEQIVLPQTTREVVEAIASRSSIASIRMHSSIIAYSFGIPTVGLAWNDKLPYFYEAIGHPERLLPFGDWTANTTFDALRKAGVAPEFGADYQAYLMTSYAFIHEAVGTHVLDSRSGPSAYEFDAVAQALVERSSDLQEDDNDLRFKMGKAERAYFRRFIDLRKKNSTIRDLADQAQTLSQKTDRLSDANRTLKQQLTLQKAEMRAQAQKIRNLNQQVGEKQKELDLRFSSRLARYIKKSVRSGQRGES